MNTFPKIALLSIVALFSFGCAQNYYNVPRETFEKKVRVLGIAPFFTDGDSDIRHPEKEALVALVREMNLQNQPELAARLKQSGPYLSVRMIEGQPDQLFSSLFFRRERRSDAGVTYNKYFYKQPELKELIEKNSVDAVMLVVVSGLTMPDKLYSSSYLAYLDYDYDFLTMTAQILDAQGNILWEYPNFQQHLRSLTPLVNLQYADFDEAAANVTDKVDVKFKTVSGISRVLGKSSSSSARKEGKVSSSYQAIFEEMVAMLKPQFQLPWEKKREETAREQAGQEIGTSRTMYAKQPEPRPVMAPLPAAPAPVSVPAAVPEPPPLQPGEIRTETLK